MGRRSMRCSSRRARCLILRKRRRRVDGVTSTREVPRIFKARALRSTVIDFHRDARIVTETAPALRIALVAVESPTRSPRPFKMRALRPLPGCRDVLFVAAGSAALQALYLAEALCAVGPAAASALFGGAPRLLPPIGPSFETPPSALHP